MYLNYIVSIHTCIVSCIYIFLYLYIVYEYKHTYSWKYLQLIRIYLLSTFNIYLFIVTWNSSLNFTENVSIGIDSRKRHNHSHLAPPPSPCMQPPAKFRRPLDTMVNPTINPTTNPLESCSFTNKDSLTVYFKKVSVVGTGHLKILLFLLAVGNVSAR